MNIQYIIIAIIFLAAVVFLFRKFFPSKKQTGGCGKGCGCDYAKKEVDHIK